MSTVYVYTQPGCQPCKLVLSRLSAAGVKHRAIDISKDSLMHDYVVQQLGAKSTPVIEAQGFKPIFGFKPDAINEIIDRYGTHGEPDYNDIHDYVYDGDE